jgi:tetratricopeptide (TPR) repeat protein
MSKKDLPNLKDVSRIPDELIPVIQWWNRNGRLTSWIIAAIVAVSAFCYWHVDKSDEAQDVTSVGFAISSTAEEFAANRQQSEASAVAATIAEARALNVNGEYEAALALVDTLVVEEPALAVACSMNKVAALEGLKRYDDALAVLDALPTDTFLKDEAIYAKARLLCQKGDKVAAKGVLAPLATTTKAKALMNMIEAYGAPLAEEAPVVETPAPAPALEPEAPAAAPVAEAPAAEAPAEVAPAVEAPAAQ